MNILYIIGNGLDIAHHMKTSYQDFFENYLTLASSDADIIKMKKNIDQHKYETWADLEIGMGAYARQCDDKVVFLKCLSDIKSSLKKYLQKESEKISYFSTNSVVNFADPGRFLEPEPMIRYRDYLNGTNLTFSIDVITLNYTNTLEYLLGYRGSGIQLTSSSIIRTINHLHGTLDNMMVMGVNDASQIYNPGIRTDEDVIEEFIKPEYNDACLNNKNFICEALIKRADIIVLYGTSLGLSDDKWWKLIGKRMETDRYPLLLYLLHDTKKNLAAEPNHLRRWTLESVREIKNKFSIQLEESVLAKRMCVAINKQLFPLTRAKLNNAQTK